MSEKIKKAKELKDFEDLHKLLEKRILDTKIQTFDDFKNLLNNYNTPDLEKAVNILFDAINKKKKIVGIHDSDTDGLGTATLTYRFYSHLIKYNVQIHITDRKQGYGFLPQHLDEFPADLYFTADNGITSIEACKKAKERGVSVIINDHHQPEKINGNFVLPDADAIVDPYKSNDPFEFKDISGTVVYFIMLWKLLEKFGMKDKQEEFYKMSSDLLALTTLSDVMPLNISINRFIVNDFIDNHFHDPFAEYMRTYKRLQNCDPRADDFAFTLIPALNATQRMASPIYGFHFLIQHQPEESEKWMNYLFSLNNERKSKQQELLNFIEKYYKDWIKDKDFILIPGQFKKEYEGVLGIIAGKLAEKYKRPTIVLSLKDGENFSGSGRSVGKINILNIFRDIREKHPDLFTHLGGHKQALGLGFHKDKLNLVFTELQKYMKEHFTIEDYSPTKVADFSVTINQANIWDLDLYNELLKWEPFGHKFPKPTFETECFVSGKRIIGKEKNHMTLTLTDNNKILSVKGLWFFFDVETEKNLKNGTKIKVIWYPDIDSWGGVEKLSFRIQDVQILKTENNNENIANDKE